jgi:hypothetical protein
LITKEFKTFQWNTCIIMANIVWKKEKYNHSVTIVNFMLNNNRCILTKNAAQDFKAKIDILFHAKMSNYSKYLFESTNKFVI